MYTKVKWCFAQCLNHNNTYPPSFSRTQMIHCATKGQHVQLIASKKNATVMQDMKAVTPAWEEIISRGSSGLQQWGASRESTSKTPVQKKNYLECRGETCIWLLQDQTDTALVTLCYLIKDAESISNYYGPSGSTETTVLITNTEINCIKRI